MPVHFLWAALSCESDAGVENQKFDVSDRE